MIRTLLLASALLAGGANLASAAQGPQLIGSGDNAQLVYDNAGPRNIVGGGIASISGSTDNASVVYSLVSHALRSLAGPSELARVGQGSRGA